MGRDYHCIVTTTPHLPQFLGELNCLLVLPDSGRIPQRFPSHTARPPRQHTVGNHRLVGGSRRNLRLPLWLLPNIRLRRCSFNSCGKTSVSVHCLPGTNRVLGVDEDVAIDVIVVIVVVCLISSLTATSPDVAYTTRHTINAHSVL